ncbi:amine sulfotransferase-like isoform X1 [Mizuhopecten yessoensis]|uniref:amine sulfotransferase-like isoform X1 n=1 Tax=Mizuhopecten yessoensis TaxID=6573 RepID=UPI000B458182|nr:amine sulfotransferase-like isoform X1 [Mizuhopecten yessoensis]
MAEWVEERDEDGNVLKTKKYDGKYYVSHFIGNVKDHLDAIDDMAVREDDTFVISYPKSGTHWMFTLAKMLRTGDTSYHGSPTFLDFNEMEKLNNMPSPRIFATHMIFDRLPRQAREGKGKILVIFRNPKDVVASLHEFIKKLDHSDVIASWPGLLKFYMEGKMTYGSWFDHIQAWDKTKKEYKGDNIMYLIYEDMKKDLRSHVGEIAPFLGANTETDFLDKVTDKCTFRNMVSEATKTFTPDDQWKEVTSTKTLPIYRKGEIGDWKNHFTVAQNEYFNKVYEEKMANNSFHFRFE